MISYIIFKAKLFLEDYKRENKWIHTSLQNKTNKYVLAIKIIHICNQLLLYIDCTLFNERYQSQSIKNVNILSMIITSL